MQSHALTISQTQNRVPENGVDRWWSVQQPWVICSWWFRPVYILSLLLLNTFGLTCGRRMELRGGPAEADLQIKSQKFRSCPSKRPHRAGALRLPLGSREASTLAGVEGRQFYGNPALDCHCRRGLREIKLNTAWRECFFFLNPGHVFFPSPIHIKTKTSEKELKEVDPNHSTVH